jgi:hypothetical protein
MHNWNILPRNIIHHHFANIRFGQQIPIPEEQKIAALEGRFH